MRINPSTGEIISYDDLYCPFCEAYLEDSNYPYCDECNSYVGIVYHEVIEQGMTQSEYDEKVENLEKELEELKKELEELEKEG